MEFSVLLSDVIAWVQANVFVVTNLVQMLFVICTFAAFYILYKKVMHDSIVNFTNNYLKRNILLQRMSRSVDEILVAVLSCVVFYIATFTMDLVVVDIFINLSIAWIVIRLASSMVENPFFAKIIAFLSWTVAALNITGFLEPTTAILSALSIKVGTTTITALMVIEAIFAVSMLLWVAVFISNAISTTLKNSKDITPSVQVLVSKIVKFLMISVAIFIALNSVGIDLTMFAVFTGALGVGIGLGLQSPAANLISGIILLLDKSVKPNDVIELVPSNNKNHGKFGVVSKMAARHTEIVDRNGRAHLIPNVDLLNQKVINYSHGNAKNKKRIRREMFFITTNKEDPERIKAICEQAALLPSRVLNDPEPRCHMRGFNGYAFEWKMRFWVGDPHNGASGVTGEVFMAVWNALKDANIEVPDPEQLMFIAKQSDRSDWIPNETDIEGNENDR